MSRCGCLLGAQPPSAASPGGRSAYPPCSTPPGPCLSLTCRTISSTPANAFKSLVYSVTHQPLPAMQTRVVPARGLGALAAASMAFFTEAWNTERGACTCKEQMKIHSKFGCDESVDPASKLLSRDFVLEQSTPAQLSAALRAVLERGRGSTRHLRSSSG